MRNRIKTALHQICEDERTEALWCNTLSMLEHTGARKISRTVGKEHPGLDVLDHIADEARHAMAFKRLAVAINGADPGDAYIAGRAAKTYFYKLDRELSAWLRRLIGRPCQYETYLLVTTMIEKRAMELYPLYKTASSHTVVHEELTRVIREEQGHRVSIEERCMQMLSEYNMRSLSVAEAVEQAFFSEFWSTLEIELGLRTEDEAA